MKTRLLITDLTRMRSGHVCLSGYDEQGRCVRPNDPRIQEELVKRDGRFFVYPRAVVELDLLEPRPQPPHVEDYAFNAFSLRFVRQARPREFGQALLDSLAPSVQAIFAQPIENEQGYFVPDGQGARSVGTVRPRDINKVVYGPGGYEAGAWDYRLQFHDESGQFYSLKVTDLTWHRYCDLQRGPGRQPPEIAARLTGLLRARKVLLRVGLARGWAEHRGRCYLQINGVYTSPDYLGGQVLPDLQRAQAASSMA